MFPNWKAPPGAECATGGAGTPNWKTPWPVVAGETVPPKLKPLLDVELVPKGFAGSDGGNKEFVDELLETPG